jgi:hypothetical protein
MTRMVVVARNNWSRDLVQTWERGKYLYHQLHVTIIALPPDMSESATSEIQINVKGQCAVTLSLLNIPDVLKAPVNSNYRSR